jgi:hypothetical protein
VVGAQVKISSLPTIASDTWAGTLEVSVSVEGGQQDHKFHISYDSDTASNASSSVLASGGQIAVPLPPFQGPFQQVVTVAAQVKFGPQEPLAGLLDPG